MRFTKFYSGIISCGTTTLFIRAVVGEAVDDVFGGEFEGGGDSGGGSHVVDGGLTSKEAGDSEAVAGEVEMSLGAFFVELGGFNLDVGRIVGTVGDSGFGTGEVTEVVIVGVVAIQDDDFGVHLEEGRLGGGVVLR